MHLHLLSGPDVVQGMDRLGVRQVPEGSGEQGKMEKTGCKIICGAPTTLMVKGLMMMMMMMMMMMIWTRLESEVSSQYCGHCYIRVSSDLGV